MDYPPDRPRLSEAASDFVRALARLAAAEDSAPRAATAADQVTPEPLMSETDQFGRHEVMDRASVLMRTWETFILEHGFVTATPELLQAAQKAFDAQFAFYQLAGAIALDSKPTR